MLRRARGFTLIEVVVTITLFALLVGWAAPSFVSWIRNAQVRTVSDALQGGVRLAQAEAVRRHRQVVFFRTAQAACNTSSTASASGSFWAVRTLPLMAGDVQDAVQCGVLSEAADVAITGSTAICFNSIGRQVANADPAIGGAACALDASGTSSFDINSSHADRPLRVLVTLGGGIRLCDPAKTLSSSAPDGCP